MFFMHVHNTFFTMSLTISSTVSLIAAILGKVVYSQPQLSVNPTVIGVRDSVHLTCEAPQGLHEDQTQCSFTTVTGRSIRRDSGCSVSITGGELVRLGGHSGKSQIKIYCMYTLDTTTAADGKEYSAGSHPVTVTVVGKFLMP
ncbi:hypothetical protein GN956_G26742 [Arapaima gigas]